MNPIEDLKTEHEAVKVTLRVLDSMINDADRTGQITNPAHMAQLIEFFRTFVDKCHHSKEEDLLFPALEEVGVSKKEGAHWCDAQGASAGPRLCREDECRPCPI